MKKIVLVLLGLISMSGFATSSGAAKDKDGQQLSAEQSALVNSTVVAAVNAATTTVGASVVSGTIISHIG